MNQMKVHHKRVVFFALAFFINIAFISFYEISQANHIGDQYFSNLLETPTQVHLQLDISALNHNLSVAIEQDRIAARELRYIFLSAYQCEESLPELYNFAKLYAETKKTCFASRFPVLRGNHINKDDIEYIFPTSNDIAAGFRTFHCYIEMCMDTDQYSKNKDLVREKLSQAYLETVKLQDLLKEIDSSDAQKFIVSYCDVFTSLEDSAHYFLRDYPYYSSSEMQMK